MGANDTWGQIIFSRERRPTRCCDLIQIPPSGAGGLTSKMSTVSDPLSARVGSFIRTLISGNSAGLIFLMGRVPKLILSDIIAQFLSAIDSYPPRGRLLAILFAWFRPKPLGSEIINLIYRLIVYSNQRVASQPQRAGHPLVLDQLLGRLAQNRPQL